MKKTTKLLLAAAFVFAVGGTAFGIAGICVGFRFHDFRAAYESGKLRAIVPQSWKEDVAQIAANIGASDAHYLQSYTQIEELELDLGNADCTVLPSETEEWIVKGYDIPARFTCEQDGGTLKLGTKGGLWSVLDAVLPVSRDARLELYVPQNQLIHKMNIDVGIGDLEMTGGMLRCERMELDCGVGGIRLSADITEELKVDGGVGDAQIRLLGEEQDFDYDIDNGVGTVRIGEDHYFELGSDTRIDNDADKEIEIDSGVGDVTLEFCGND